MQLAVYHLLKTMQVNGLRVVTCLERLPRNKTYLFFMVALNGFPIFAGASEPTRIFNGTFSNKPETLESSKQA